MDKVKREKIIFSIKIYAPYQSFSQIHIKLMFSSFMFPLKGISGYFSVPPLSYSNEIVLCEPPEPSILLTRSK